jgi:hypothetical protein
MGEFTERCAIGDECLVDALGSSEREFVVSIRIDAPVPVNVILA